MKSVLNHNWKNFSHLISKVFFENRVNHIIYKMNQDKKFNPIGIVSQSCRGGESLFFYLNIKDDEIIINPYQDNYLDFMESWLSLEGGESPFLHFRVWEIGVYEGFPIVSEYSILDCSNLSQDHPVDSKESSGENIESPFPLKSDSM